VLHPGALGVPRSLTEILKIDAGKIRVQQSEWGALGGKTGFYGSRSRCSSPARPSVGEDTLTRNGSVPRHRSGLRHEITLKMALPRTA